MTRPLRIALASDWYLPRLGGIELHLRDLAQSLRACGHEVHIVTSTPDDRDDDARVHRLDVARLPGSGVAVSPLLLRRLRHVLAEGRYDVVHAHASVVSPVAYGALLAARELGMPAIVTFHSVLHASARLLRVADALLGWSRWPLLATAVSSRVAGQLRDAMPQLPVEVLPNGVDGAFWRRDAGARSDVSMIRVVSAMRLHRKKRPASLLRAVAAARMADPRRSLHLTIFGDGPERRALERLRSRLGLEDAVTLAGARPRAALRDAYAAAHLFALPTQREAFGIAALEARCAGLPVVAMRASGVGDFLEHGRDALLASDDTELAAHIARLAASPALRATLTPRAVDGHRFDWPSVAARHAACYERVAASGPASGTSRTAVRGRNWRTVSSR